MRMIFNYIEPIFVSVTQKSSEHYIISARCKNKDFQEEFTIGADANDTVLTLENTLHLLSQFIPNKRRFFCSSKKIMSNILTAKNINTFYGLLVKRVCQNTFAEIISYFNVDEYLSNIGIADIDQIKEETSVSDIDKIIDAYNAIITNKKDEYIVDSSYMAHKTVEDYKNSLTWVEQIKGGQDNLGELFAVCGNHMLGNNFDIQDIKEKQFKIEQQMRIIVNRETAISDIQEKSMLNTAKAFMSATKSGNIYTIQVSCDGVRTSYDIDITNPDIDSWPINGVISPRRVFVGYGSETLKNINEIVKATVQNKELHELFIEMASTYVDMSKPFEKILIGKDFNYMANLFKIKRGKVITDDYAAFDKKIFEDIKASIDTCVSACSAFLVPMSVDKFNETYKAFFNAVFGQSFKYFYNVSPEVSV